MQPDLTYSELSFLQRLNWRWAVYQDARRRRKARSKSLSYDLIVTTYIDRFDSYFKSTLFQLSRLFPDQRIIVAVNGHHDSARQELFLLRLKKHLTRYSMVKMVSFDAPVGLSRMWNAAIRASMAEKMLVLNDDIYLMACFRKQLEDSGLLRQQVALINGSWSHFLITRKVFNSVGEFDERFTEIGYEDDDYSIRLARSSVALPNMRLQGIINCVDRPDEYSYGPQMEIIEGKYSLRNKKYFFEKWDVSDTSAPDRTYCPKLQKWIKPRDLGQGHGSDYPCIELPGAG